MSKEYVNMTLYLNPVSREDMPAIFDDVATAVKIGNISPTTGEVLAIYFNDLMSQTPSLNMKYRVAYSGNTAFRATECRYCKLEYYANNSDDTPMLRDTYYFWVEENRWIANQTLEVSLKMDVLQTLEASLEKNGTDFDDIFDARTMIHRMHKDRFSLYDTRNVQAIVDETPEQLGTFTLLKRSDEIVKDSRFDATNMRDTLRSMKWDVYYGKITTYERKESELEVTERQGTLIFTDKDSGAAVNVSKTDGTTQVGRLSRFALIDTSYSGITKLIELPYLPFVTSVTQDSDGTLTFNVPILDRDYALVGQYGKYNESETIQGIGAPSTIFDRIALPTDSSGNKNYPCITSYMLTDVWQQVTTRNMSNALADAKLLHSDFYDLRFVYDSFSWSVKFEQLGKPTEIPRVRVYFVASSAPVSRFGFVFEKVNWKYSSVGVTSESDFDFMDCSRNNEVTLYNDEYLNYLRNGYNFDVKSRVIGAATQLASGAASVALGFAVGGGVGVAASATSALIGSISSFAQGDNSMQSKMASLQARSASVSGSDSLSLMKSYSSNKLHLMKYSVNETISNMLSDLFYYYGYRCAHQGKPSTTSRHWFNFVQCSPKFSRTWLNRLPKYMRDELSRLCEYGVTRYHKDTSVVNVNLVLGYDVDQKMENFESAIWARLPE